MKKKSCSETNQLPVNEYNFINNNIYILRLPKNFGRHNFFSINLKTAHCNFHVTVLMCCHSYYCIIYHVIVISSCNNIVSSFHVSTLYILFVLYVIFLTCFNFFVNLLV